MYFDNKIFIGNIEELSEIDKRLATKLQASNVTQVALIEVWGDNQPLGILGVTWSEHEVLSTILSTYFSVLSEASI